MTEHTELTPEQLKEFTDLYTGLIRYGYQEAIDEIMEFVEDHSKLENIKPLGECHIHHTTILDKLIQMSTNKKQLDFNKLKSELPSE